MDFENLHFDEKFEEDKTDCHESLQTKEDKTLHQETTDEALAVSGAEHKNMAEQIDEEQSDNGGEEEDFKGAGISLASMDKTQEEDNKSSDSETEEESADSGEGDEEGDMRTGEMPGGLLMSVYCSDEFCYDNKEDRVFAEGQPPALEGTEVQNEEQGENTDEVSNFGQIPERDNEMMIQGEETDEDEQDMEEETQEDSSDSEGLKTEQENILPRCFEQEVESPYKDEPVEDGLEGTEALEQNLQDLIAAADDEEYVEKMKDFLGEEHQEAGESFADYPSDLSSCECVEHAEQNQQNEYKTDTLSCQESAATDCQWMGIKKDTNEEEDEYLYSRDLQMDADMFMGLDMATEGNGKTEIEIIKYGCDEGEEESESDSYSSSDDERVYSDNMCLEDLGSYRKLEGSQEPHSESGAACPDDHHLTNRVTVGDLNINWDFDFFKTDTLLCEDLLTTEDVVDKVETSPSDVSHAEDINSYSVVQREDTKTTSLSYQGSLDDGFFFNTEPEASRMSELGHVGDDEYEVERNWEQEQERIKAFFKFYDDSDEENWRGGE